MDKDSLTTLTYDSADGIARITLNRPKRGNGITLKMPRELEACVEWANLDPSVHVIALSGNGPGFCGGYDFTAVEEWSSGADQGADGGTDGDATPAARPWPEGAPVDPMVVALNHNPGDTWDPVVDYQMMNRNVRGFMSLFHSDKPVVAKVHGFCVAGGTDMVLCADLLVVEDTAKIGYPPARVWGAPTTALWTAKLGPERAKRLLFTGDSLSGTQAVEWGLAIESAPADQLDERFEALVRRIAQVPVSQLVLHKLLVNQSILAQGLPALQTLGPVFDGLSRHTPEGFAFTTTAMEQGWREAVRQRDEPFGDLGSSTFKG
jgi:enoyl-CoA hydratase